MQDLLVIYTWNICTLWWHFEFASMSSESGQTSYSATTSVTSNCGGQSCILSELGHSLCVLVEGLIQQRKKSRGKSRNTVLRTGGELTCFVNELMVTRWAWLLMQTRCGCLITACAGGVQGAGPVKLAGMQTNSHSKSGAVFRYYVVTLAFC